jgi:hypothetical protein
VTHRTEAGPACGKVAATHRQILCHVSWHLKQM